MTRFMEDVGAVLAGADVPGVATSPSHVGPVAAGTHRQVSTRSLAEQLVCEANAVLAEHPGRSVASTVELVDEVRPGVLSFTLRCGPRAARVQTTVSGHTAVVELIGTEAGTCTKSGTSRELASDDDLEHLILSLLQPGSVLPADP